MYVLKEYKDNSNRRLDTAKGSVSISRRLGIAFKTLRLGWRFHTISDSCELGLRQSVYSIFMKINVVKLVIKGDVQAK